ncbi:MAG: dihydroorotase [Desulfobacteraceae bacterium]|nr:dihydroorotase [Desulfobacteraceae bacterium]MCB9494903.1 dihydroorotase [Desulfobacteraceae bacterium]
MRILIKNGTCLVFGKGEQKTNIYIEDQIIKEISSEEKDADKVIDASGMYVFPGLIDVHVHLREPGQEYKETIESGAKAAAKGGFTDICCMPNTIPVNDSPSITSFIKDRALTAGFSNVHPVASLTKGLKGEEICDYGELKQAGAIALSDDGRPVSDSGVMRRAVEYAKAFDLPVMCHSEELSLSGKGVMNEGVVSTRLGLTGIPDSAESLGVKRDIEIGCLVDYPVHIAHVSAKKTIEIIRNAKKSGTKVTAETAPHYFTLTEDAIDLFNTYAKMNPPLRTESDRLAIIEALKDNTIDIIATDHAPHSDEEKIVPFEEAAFGITGLETSLALSLNLVFSGILSMEELAEKMSINPGKVIGINNALFEGNHANITIVNPDFEWTVTREGFISKSKNSPFTGKKLKGICEYTIKNGNIIWSRNN